MFGPAHNMADDKLVAMLAKPPREVKELQSKSAFKRFFRGIEKDRMERLLMKCYEGNDARKEKTKKRMKLLEGEFLGDHDFLIEADNDNAEDVV